MLRQMADYLSGLKSFTVQNFAVDEMALKTGEKSRPPATLTSPCSGQTTFRNTQRGAGEGLGLVRRQEDDRRVQGEQLVRERRRARGHRRRDRQAAQAFKVDAPGADLLYSNPYDILMEQVKSGRVIGPETIQGVPAKHLAFQGEVVDFQTGFRTGRRHCRCAS